MRTFAFAVMLAALPAQQIVTPATVARGPVLATKDGLTLPAGAFSIVDLVDAVSGYLCRNYLFDYGALDKLPGFTLQRSIALDAIGSEEIPHALLAARGLAALPVDELRGVWQIVPLAPDQRTLPVTNVPWRTPEDILRRPRLHELVMTVITLQRADAQQLAGALRMQFSLQGTWQPGVPIACASGPRTLLLHGYRDQIAPLLVILQQIDRMQEAPPPPPSNETLLARLDALEREVAALRAELQAAKDPRAPATKR